VLTGAQHTGAQHTQHTYSFDLTGDELPVFANPRIKRTPKKIPEVPGQSPFKKLRTPALDLVVESNDLQKKQLESVRNIENMLQHLIMNKKKGMLYYVFP
jgi:hypothetical protein